MCLIILSPNVQKTRIKRTVLERGFDKNGDGAGMAFIDNGVLKILKTDHVLFNDFYADYQDIRAGLKGPLLIHFRKLTKGSKSEMNTQPLGISSDLVMAHNGTIDPLTKTEEDVSDSVQLARLLRRLKWEFPYSRAQVDLLSVACNNKSKLVFLDNKGRFQIVNAALGKWKEGAWYSDACECFEVPFWQRHNHGYSQSYGPAKPKANIAERVKQTRLVHTAKAQTVRQRELNAQWESRLAELESAHPSPPDRYHPAYGTPTQNDYAYSD